MLHLIAMETDQSFNKDEYRVMKLLDIIKFSKSVRKWFMTKISIIILVLCIGYDLYIFNRKSKSIC